MKEIVNKTITFFKQPKVINTIIILLFLIILISSAYIRLQNLPLLIDQTTGEYLPLALDPYYFLRVAEVIVEQGSLPLVDSMRYPSLNLSFTNELTPYATVLIYKVINIFTPVSLQFANVISPVIFFVLGLIIFFFFTWILTKSKYIALLSLAFLAFIPPYLYRTMAGFSDHESIGMFAFFLVLLSYVLILKYLESENYTKIKTILYSSILAILFVFANLSWSGAFSILIMIIPFSFLLIWLIKFKDVDNLKSMFHYASFYFLWIILTCLFGILLGSNVIMRFTSSSGVIGLLALVFILVHYLLAYLISKNYIKDNLREKILRHKLLTITIITIFLGILVLPILGKSIFTVLRGLSVQIFRPFGTDRVALTVAENAQPYLIDWISQIGKMLFWFSFAGMSLIGLKFKDNISTKDGKYTFFIIWMIFLSSMLFTRLYQGAPLDGQNFLSQIIYLGGLLIFGIFGLKVYLKNEIKLNSNLILLITLILISLISLRSAARVFFLIVPFTCVFASFFIINIKNYINSRDEFFKFMIIIIFIASIICSFNIIYSSYEKINNQAKSVGPSAHPQWQEAMSWVRENTLTKTVFSSWWDYGYWIQYLGQRPTITDGGHGNAYWDHLIGRYVLTTPNPLTAMSFMKSHNVNYLLIDQTDFGKYPAYSRIGSNDYWDRFSILNVGVIDDTQTQEDRHNLIRTYPYWGVVDKDITYNYDGNEILLPGPSYDSIGQPMYKSFLGAIIITETNGSIQQPEGIFMYNDKQFKIPIRYLYLNKQLIDFGDGIDGIIYLIPKIDQLPNGQIKIDNLGALTYLSTKVYNSLFAQLYLLNDVFNNYPTIRIAHVEDDGIVKNLKLQLPNLGDFVYFGGLRGPIKIFEVQYSNDVEIYEEFTSLSGNYAEFDYLFQ